MKNKEMNIKSIIFILCLVGIFSCGEEEKFTVNCLPSNLQNGVITFYPFNGGSLNDESPNTNHLNNPTTAVPTTDRNGNVDCAYIFDNAQPNAEFLTTTDSDFLNGLSKFSISLWYEPHNSSITGTNIEGIFSRGDETRCPNKMGEWSVGLYDCRRPVFGHDASVWASMPSNPSMSCQDEIDMRIDKWHHIVAIKNNDEYKIYINGVLNETKNGDAGCFNFQPAQDIGDVFIGNKFTGKIDDIIIYNRVLTDTEITGLLRLGSCCR